MYRLPVFDVMANIWRVGAGPPGPPVVVSPANLALGKRVNVPLARIGDTADVHGAMWLLLPKGTDVQDFKNGVGGDIVEVPAGSGRKYRVSWVDDIGLGFANEHRFAEILGVSPWPTPFPSGGGGPPPPVPGATCLTAGAIALNTLYTFAMPVAGVQWFALPAAISTHYTVSYIINSGVMGSLVIQEGTCGLPFPDGVLTVSGTNLPFTTLMTSTAIQLQALGSLMGVGNYSFIVTSP